jgi:DNA polymerase delta subunit 1
VKRGIIPKILEYFITERKKVRAQIETVTDVALKTVLEGRQVALKVCANAIYGATGAPQSFLQHLAIAEGTVLQGASMLRTLKKVIEERYTLQRLPTLEWMQSYNMTLTGDIKVIYGDTGKLS